MVSRVRPLDKLRTTVDFDGEDYGLARTVVAVRVAVVISIAVLMAIGPQWVRQHAVATVAVLAAALVYSAVLMAYPQLEVRRTRYSWLVSGFDSAFTLALIALSGGVYSPVVAVLALAVIASAARLSLNETLLVAILLGAAYIPVALMSSPRLPGHCGSGATGRLVGAVSHLRRDYHRRAVRARRTRTPLPAQGAG
jgi:hypothetical protein